MIWKRTAVVVLPKYHDKLLLNHVKIKQPIIQSIEGELNSESLARSIHKWLSDNFRENWSIWWGINSLHQYVAVCMLCEISTFQQMLKVPDGENIATTTRLNAFPKILISCKQGSWLTIVSYQLIKNCSHSFNWCFCSQHKFSTSDQDMIMTLLLTDTSLHLLPPQWNY